MWKSYLKIAIRNLRRSKIYSFINIAGLSLGLACAMLIILYVKDEVSFDRFLPNVNHIYRIASYSFFNGKEDKSGNTGYLQGPRFKENVPGIDAFVRVQSGSEDMKKGNEVLSRNVLYVDSNFFKVFNFPLVGGDPVSCLTGPNSIVISEKESQKQFGTRESVGKMIMIRKDSVFTPYQVTAVAKEVPQNSSIQFDVLLPFQQSEADANDNENWFNFFLNTFVVVSPNADISRVEKQMQSFYKKDAEEAFRKAMKKYGGNPDEKLSEYFLQPFTGMHMSTDLPAQNGLSNASNPMYSYILSGIALFVLLIACINFINLTVARSVKRAKEIGVRKVVGGSRKQLIFQFLGESFVICFLAFLFAILLVQLILPVFNQLSDKALSLSYLLDAKLIAGYVLLFLITGCLAGFYPALVLSGYRPVAILYSRFSLGGKNYLQKSLVVLQFALASFLITGTLVIYSQFNFLTNTPLGYDDDHVIEIPVNDLTHSKAAIFQSALLENRNILVAAPKNGGFWNTMAKLPNDSNIMFQYETIDENYFSALKIPLVSGRNFSAKYPADSVSSVVVNEAFVKKAGWKDPLGKTVNFFFNDNEIYQVIGVVKDYHSLPLNEEIKPQLFTMKNNNHYGIFDIRIKPGTATASLKYIRTKFKDYFPMSPYSYVFKDEQNRKSYEAEEKWKQILMFGAILTIFISCIGLFGLTVSSTEKRTKEIGIRKVLGASVNNIVSILSIDFLKLVLIALLIAVPVGWMVSGQWLENYPYRIALAWYLFAGAAIMVVFIALLTVSFQAIKAAIANPVNSLRSE